MFIGGGLSRVWCVMRVTSGLEQSQLSCLEGGGEEKIHHHIIHVTFSLFMNKLYSINLIIMVIREKRNRKC